MLSVVVNGVIVDDKGRVLIAQRTSMDDHEPGKWTTPGGNLESDGEDHNIIESTLHREIYEEVGIIVADDIKLIANNTFVKPSGKQTLVLVFLCKYVSGKPAPLDDIDQVAWVTEDQLSAYSFPLNVKEYFEAGFKEMSEG